MLLPWKRHLTCPKCSGEFDYEYYPGASLTAVRLWNRRYMARPLCRCGSVFPVSQVTVPTAAAPP
ncbi:MAG TPA: hypothetical protein VN842_03985 [Thermoplasmata archaeon]|nr:hypothetical protein [Thermoplasmata archaeon]